MLRITLTLEQVPVRQRSSAGLERRRFTIQDAMILIVAAAFGLAMSRDLFAGAGPRPILVYGIVGFYISLIVLTPTVLTMRLARPRPTIVQLCRDPGFVATLIGAVFSGFGLVAVALIASVRVTFGNGRGVRSSLISPGWWAEVPQHCAPGIGGAVLAAWVLLAISGRRRPDRGWMGAAGRALGVGWIILFAADYIRLILPFF